MVQCFLIQIALTDNSTIQFWDSTERFCDFLDGFPDGTVIGVGKARLAERHVLRRHLATVGRHDPFRIVAPDQFGKALAGRAYVGVGVLGDNAILVHLQDNGSLSIIAKFDINMNEFLVKILQPEYPIHPLTEFTAPPFGLHVAGGPCQLFVIACGSLAQHPLCRQFIVGVVNERHLRQRWFLVAQRVINLVWNIMIKFVYLSVYPGFFFIGPVCRLGNLSCLFILQDHLVEIGFWIIRAEACFRHDFRQRAIVPICIFLNLSDVIARPFHRVFNGNANDI